jgi:DNA-directed RNA polymerase subunit RPC12/RpoP
MSNTYTCAACSGVFDKGWSDEEALAEKEENWGDMSMDDMEVVCDDCYRKMMGLPALEGEGL